MNYPGLAYNDLALSAVRLNDSFYINALRKETAYLKSLSADKLLAGFFETRGLTPKSGKYSGWESTEIQGHTLGHYLSAMAQAYQTTEDPEILSQLEYCVNELKKCQFDSGYLFASPEEFFDRVEKQTPVWVPWYTMHKIIEGLVQVCTRTAVKGSLDILIQLADWICRRTSTWDEDLQKTVLKVEYGGMNDCLYDTYLISGKKEHLEAAHMFDEIALFDQIHKGNDILNDLHANTTIPKFTGAMKRYIVLGESERFYLETAERFWEMVVNHHSYITGGNSEWEHFGKSDVLDAERSGFNCEMCNTYNMLKLSKGLFMISGRQKYLEFFENTNINAILSSQDPETGMTMYFQPMATGYFKVFGTPFDKFWCCTGTGMENFTKLNDGVFYANGPELIVSRYISAEFEWKEHDILITMEAPLSFPEKAEFSIKRAANTSGTSLTIRLRIPDWCTQTCSVKVNETSRQVSETEKENGFISINRKWQQGDKFTFFMPTAVRFSRLPDNPNAVAFLYGPYVLSAGLGSEDMELSRTGIMVDIPTRNMEIKDYLNLKNHTVNEWLKDLSANLLKTDGKMEFRLKNTDEDDSLVFIPHYLQVKERYGIYWYLFGTDSDSLRKELRQKEEARNKLESATIDSIPVGNDQYELQHEAQGENTFADTYNGAKFREARKGGWFSYKMAVRPDCMNQLRLEMLKKWQPSKAEIYADDALIATIETPQTHPPVFYHELIDIPEELTSGKEQITIKFINIHEEHGFGTVGLMRMLKK